MIKIKRLLTEIASAKLAFEYLSNLIKGSEFENHVFAAGGYPRDELMGAEPHDLDVVVDLPQGGIKFAEWATKKMGNYKESSNPVTFEKFGTAKFTLQGIIYKGVDLSDTDVEAVQTRTEKYTSGSRKPETDYGTLKQDVFRRDANFNALLKNLSTGEILDLTGKGIDDLKRGIVRTPIDPDKTFEDDSLRMLRLIRFSMKYDFDIPMSIIRSMRKNASQLQNISSERIRDELDKMLVTAAPDRAIKLLQITGLSKYIFPELDQLIGLQQNVWHKHDAMRHTLEVLKKTNPNIITRLAGLLHDVGKYVTKTVTPTGVHFYGHEQESAKIARDILKRLAYPNEMINAIVKGIENHMRLKHGGDDSLKLSDKALRKFKIEMGDNLENVMDLISADNLSHSDAASMPNQIDNVRKRLAALDIKTEKPKLPIDGNDLKNMGISPGPIYKEILDKVLDAWYSNPSISRSEAENIVNNVIKSKNNS